MLSRFLSVSDRSLPQVPQRREGKELGSAVSGVTRSLSNHPAPAAWPRRAGALYTWHTEPQRAPVQRSQILLVATTLLPSYFSAQKSSLFLSCSQYLISSFLLMVWIQLYSCTHSCYDSSGFAWYSTQQISVVQGIALKLIHCLYAQKTAFSRYWVQATNDFCKCSPSELGYCLRMLKRQTPASLCLIFHFKYNLF